MYLLLFVCGRCCRLFIVAEVLVVAIVCWCVVPCLLFVKVCCLSLPPMGVKCWLLLRGVCFVGCLWRVPTCRVSLLLFVFCCCLLLFALRRDVY